MKCFPELLPDKRQTRFLEELDHHREDCGHDAYLGPEELLISHFNGYVMERRQRNNIIIAIITILAFAFPFCTILISSGNIDMIDEGWQALIVVPSIIFMIPAMIILTPVLIFVPTFPSYFELLFITPPITAFCWFALSYMLLNAPPKFLHRFARK